MYISRSTNGGITWSPSAKVNGPSNYTRTFNSYPCVVVKSNGATDSVLVTWGKLRNIPGPQAITQLGNSIPKKFVLEQNYPNPFNPSTILNYDIPNQSNVQLKIYEVSGREILTLVNRQHEPGRYSIKFDGSNLASGIYFYRIVAKDLSGNGREFVQSRKMLLIK